MHPPAHSFISFPIVPRKRLGGRDACIPTHTTPRSCAELETIRTSLVPKLTSLNLQIASLSLKARTLTLTLAGESVTADDCARASQLLEAVVADTDVDGDANGTEPLLIGQYKVEVTTEGVSDVLLSQVELDAFKGFPVKVTVEKKEPDDDDEGVVESKVVWGKLLQCDDNFVRINLKGRTSKFIREHVKEIRLCTDNELKGR